MCWCFRVIGSRKHENQSFLPSHWLPETRRDRRWAQGREDRDAVEPLILIIAQVRPFYEKRMGQEVDADTLGDEFKGYVVRITGGNDKQGFPMKQVSNIAKKKTTTLCQFPTALFWNHLDIAYVLIVRLRVSWPTAGWGCCWRREPPATAPARM